MSAAVNSVAAALVAAALSHYVAAPINSITGTGATAQPRLVIGRVMANPGSVSDEHGEWFEVRNLGPNGVSLHGWRIASRNDRGHAIARAVMVPPGGQVIFGRDANPARNGGVRVDYAYGSSIRLANARDWLALEDPRGETSDSVAWTSTSGGFARIVNDRTVAARDARASAGVAPPMLGAPSTSDTSRSELVVRMLDVGQGDATLITNGSSNVLIDGGPDPVRLGALLDSLGLGGATIDVVILSHQHYDHHAGLGELFLTSRGITVRYFFENQDPYAGAALGELRDSVAARAGRGQLVYRDTDDPCGDGRALCTITLAGGAKLHVMRPYPAGLYPNDRSAPVKIVGPDSASFTMWLAGDAEHGEIGWFESARYDVTPGMRVDVLKADHHGSCNGVSSWYLRTTRPRWIAVSVGANNSYGHMHEQTMREYARFRIPWYRTDRNGTIVVRTPGTAGSGYTIDVARGSASMDGDADRQSPQQDCNPMP